MKILVTGGLGFIGNRAAHYFKDKGHNVHIVDNTEDKTLVDKALKDKFEVFWMDISSPNVNYYLDNHYDVIIHCAAQTAVTHSLADPIKDMHDNIVGTLNMCELARICDAHLIYTSTNKVYGTNPNNMIGASGYKGDPKRYYGRATHEDVSIDHTGHTPYGVSKLAADLYVQDYRRVFKIPTTVFRMSCIYGETQRGTEDQGWVYHITKQMVENKPVKIFGDGRQVRDILHVDDLVRLMEKVSR